MSNNPSLTPVNFHTGEGLSSEIFDLDPRDRVYAWFELHKYPPLEPLSDPSPQYHLTFEASLNNLFVFSQGTLYQGVIGGVSLLPPQEHVLPEALYISLDAFLASALLNQGTVRHLSCPLVYPRTRFEMPPNPMRLAHWSTEDVDFQDFEDNGNLPACFSPDTPEGHPFPEDFAEALDLLTLKILEQDTLTLSLESLEVTLEATEDKSPLPIFLMPTGYFPRLKHLSISYLAMGPRYLGSLDRIPLEMLPSLGQYLRPLGSLEHSCLWETLLHNPEATQTAILYQLESLKLDRLIFYSSVEEIETSLPYEISHLSGGVDDSSDPEDLPQALTPVRSAYNLHPVKTVLSVGAEGSEEATEDLLDVELSEDTVSQSASTSLLNMLATKKQMVETRTIVPGDVFFAKTFSKLHLPLLKSLALSGDRLSAAALLELFKGLPESLEEVELGSGLAIPPQTKDRLVTRNPGITICWRTL